MIASIVPDLIDKPLAWQFKLIANGYGPGYSIFLGVAVALEALAIGRQLDRLQLGVVFAIGYLSHNIGDVLEHPVQGQGWRAVETRAVAGVRAPGDTPKRTHKDDPPILHGIRP